MIENHTNQYFLFFNLKVACTAVSNDQTFEEKHVNLNYSPASPNKPLEVNQLLSVDCNVNAAESTHTLSPSPGM